MDLKALTQSEIEILVARHPLPEKVSDVVMNREDLSHAMATSVNTISQWIAQGMPVLQNGANGKAYEIQLSQAWAWRSEVKISEDKRSKAVQESARALRLELIGGRTGDGIDGLDPKAKREIFATQVEYEKFQAQRNQLLQRDDVADLLDNLFSLTRDTLENAPDRAEREAALPPEAVTVLIDVCDDLLGELQRRIAGFWEVRPERGEETIKRDLLDA